MGQSKKPRKAYRPKIQPAIPIVFGLQSDKKTDLRLPYHLSLEALRTGHGTSDDAHTIFSALLVARELAHKFNGADLNDALDAIAAVKERGDAGKWGVSGDQFKAISAALVLFDEMQDASTRREVREAIQKVWREAA